MSIKTTKNLSINTWKQL